jgi:hypothetical protein
MTLLLVEMSGRDRTDDTLWLPVECWLHVLTFADRRWFYQPHPKPLPPLLAQTSRLWIDAVQLPPMIVRQLFPALSNDALECVLQCLWHGARMSCDASAHLPFFCRFIARAIYFCRCMAGATYLCQCNGHAIFRCLLLCCSMPLLRNMRATYALGVIPTRGQQPSGFGWQRQSSGACLGCTDVDTLVHVRVVIVTQVHTTAVCRALIHVRVVIVTQVHTTAVCRALIHVRVVIATQVHTTAVCRALIHVRVVIATQVHTTAVCRALIHVRVVIATQVHTTAVCRVAEVPRDESFFRG